MSAPETPVVEVDEAPPAPDIVAEFDLRVADGDIVAEDDLDARLPEFGPALAAAEELQGGVTLSDRAGDATVIVSDNIDFVINRLCISTVEDLLAGRESLIRMSSYDRVFTFTPEGATVIVRKDENEVARLPLRPMLTALVDCAARFLALRPRLAAGGVAPAWVAQARAANAALRQQVAALGADG